MKKLVLLATGALMTSTAFSQISIDPEIGVNFSNRRFKLKDNDATTEDMKVGISGGVGVNFSIAKNVYLRPGIYYQNLGSKTTLPIVGESTTSLHYLRIPVNIGYNYVISDNAGAVFAEAGPYVGYAIAGQGKIGDVKADIDFGTEVGETNPLDWGFNFGLGYESPWGIYLKGGYGLGLGNMTNVDDAKRTNTHFNVSLGYRIKL